MFESRKVRRLVGRLERGDELMASLRQLADEHAISTAWVRGLGAFEWVSLCEYDQREQRYRPARRVDGPCEILTLEGNLSLKEGEAFPHVHATVSRETESGIEVLGGHLVEGRVFACELALECYDDLELRRRSDEATGLSLWTGMQPPAEPPMAAAQPANAPAPSETSASWARVAEASRALQQDAQQTEHERSGRKSPSQPQSAKAPPPVVPDPLPKKRRTTEEEFFDEPMPEKGDWVDHSRFGVCRVDGEDPEGGVIIKLPSGVRKAIKLDYLRVLPPRYEQGRRIFPVQPRKRK